MRRHPPDILITTPESLYLMLTSAAREMLAAVETVIVDEIHAVAATKRGAHLALSLERLEHLAGRAAAADRPVGHAAAAGGDRARSWAATGREVDDRRRRRRKQLDLEVVVPVDDMRELGARAPASRASRAPSIWPAIYPRLLELVRAHRSTIVFVNSRRSAERVANRLNELAEAEIARAHHGSIAREQRLRDRGPAQERAACRRWSPPPRSSSASTWARSIWWCRSSRPSRSRPGCSGSGAPATAWARPRAAASSPSSAATCSRRRWSRGACSRARSSTPGCPASRWTCWPSRSWRRWRWTSGRWTELHALVRRAYPYSELSRAQFEGVLEMLAGRYPSDEFAELRPRIVWDRLAGTCAAATAPGGWR